MKLTNRDETSDSAVSRIPALDGLRGIAILLVILCHCCIFDGTLVYVNSSVLKPLWGLGRHGWCGVELFFVLSGFLITSILFNTKESPRYFKSFYGRRALRIFPLYFAVLIIFYFGPRAIFHVYPFDPSHKLWFFTYLANWKLGFWPTNELTLFWSLCVEEQFYLVWPLVVWLTSERAFPWMCLGVISGSLAAGVGIEYSRLPDMVVWVTSVPRLQAIVFGSLLAWLVRQSWSQKVTKHMKLAIAASLALMILCAVRPPQFRGFVTFTFLMCSVTFSALVLHCCTSPDSFASRIMRSRILMSFGKYSYAIYVLHACVLHYVVNFVFFRLMRRNVSITLCLCVSFALAFAASYLAGFLSWHVFEKYFLRLKRFFPYSVRTVAEAEAPLETSYPLEGRRGRSMAAPS